VLKVQKVLRVLGVLVALCTVSTVTAAIQQPGGARYATTSEALLAAPVFFHGKQIVVRRDVESAGTLMRLAGTSKPIFVFWRDPSSMAHDTEVRGEFWDVGRLERTDSRFSSVNFQPLLDAASNGQWPAREQVFMLLNASAVESPLPPEPSIRALALAPEQYVGKGVTVTGRFRGSNLFADLPMGAGTKGRWDFVLQSADAAIWVTGIRPRGRGFDLDVNSRMDSGRWLQVAGTVRREGPLAWIDATSVQAATAPTDAPVEVTMPPPPPQPPPQVVFSTPTAGETDADRNGAIRIQFSRDMDAKTFRDRVRITYTGAAPQGAAPTAPTATVRYVEGTRALEIKLAAPLDRYRQVKVELLDGIMSAVDNQPLAPYSLTFTTGG
jgi:Big-like domain-containing protein